jgi:hypothetical protein
MSESEKSTVDDLRRAYIHKLAMDYLERGRAWDHATDEERQEATGYLDNLRKHLILEQAAPKKKPRAKSSTGSKRKEKTTASKAETASC